MAEDKINPKAGKKLAQETFSKFKHVYDSGVYGKWRFRS